MALPLTVCPTGAWSRTGSGYVRTVVTSVGYSTTASASHEGADVRDEREIRRAIAIARGHLSAIKRFGDDEAWVKKEYGSHLSEWFDTYHSIIEILNWALGGQGSISTLIEAQDDWRKLAREMKVR